MKTRQLLQEILNPPQYALRASDGRWITQRGTSASLTDSLHLVCSWADLNVAKALLPSFERAVHEKLEVRPFEYEKPTTQPERPR